ncbi:MAG: glutaredoxin family protein [Kordia sp.]|uniref:glutaredoxin family protein n=1 Tax=Kordia sp. TaxID=1965332 RepID=UPI00385BF9C4
MKGIPKIKLYGTETCHKPDCYKKLLQTKKLPYQFLDVHKNKDHAEALRNLYENRKLNFPTITIGTKKLRNPRETVLDKCLQRLLPLQE